MVAVTHVNLCSVNFICCSSKFGRWCACNTLMPTYSLRHAKCALGHCSKMVFCTRHRTTMGQSDPFERDKRHQVNVFGWQKCYFEWFPLHTGHLGVSVELAGSVLIRHFSSTLNRENQQMSCSSAYVLRWKKEVESKHIVWVLDWDPGWCVLFVCWWRLMLLLPPKWVSTTFGNEANQGSKGGGLANLHEFFIGFLCNATQLWKLLLWWSENYRRTFTTTQAWKWIGFEYSLLVGHQCSVFHGYVDLEVSFSVFRFSEFFVLNSTKSFRVLILPKNN